MSESVIIAGNTKEERYKSLLPQVKALVEGEKDLIANIANLVAALKYGMNFFWVGVYFVKDSPHSQLLPVRQAGPSSGRGREELVLGPFQGPVACTRIAFGKGICGTAWKEKTTLIVADVDKFPGHIACSPDSRSEIVVPCIKNGKVIAVLDIDSNKPSDFDKTDKKYLEEFARIIENL